MQGAFKDVHDALNVIASSEALVTVAGKRLVHYVRCCASLICATRMAIRVILKCLMLSGTYSRWSQARIDAKRAQLVGMEALYKAVGGCWAAPWVWCGVVWCSSLHQR